MKAAGALPFTCRGFDSPLGPLVLVASPAGLARIAWGKADDDAVLAELAAVLGSPLNSASVQSQSADDVNADVLDEAARQLDAYFAGRLRRFDVPLDLRGARGFRGRVLAALPEIAYGTTTSYTAIATALGNPAAARAVGGACAANPLPVVLPCHRVLRRDGSFDRYLGGTETKRWLLALEAGQTPTT